MSNQNGVYLRVSYTERCNLRCVYCMPEEGVVKRSHSETLSVEELTELVKTIDTTLGLRKVRITGGEPLVRKGIVEFVRTLRTILPNVELTLTTNGVLLAKFAKSLLDAGLERINVSLDTVNSQRFKVITRGGNLGDVINGIKSAVAQGIPVKTNTVLLKRFNADELCKIVETTASLGVYESRFIELMPIGEARSIIKQQFFDADSAFEGISKCFTVVSRSNTDKGFRVKLRTSNNGLIQVGFITPMSHSFCHKCNRLRLDSAGNLRTCLMSRQSVPLGRMLRNGESVSKIADALLLAWQNKQPPDKMEQPEQMSEIGG